MALKRNYKYKTVGVVLEEKLYSYLSLYCFAKGITKGKFIRGLLDEKAGQLKHCTESHLVQVILTNIRQEYPESLWKNKGFLNEVEESLTQKGVSSIHIQQILKEL